MKRFTSCFGAVILACALVAGPLAGLSNGMSTTNADVQAVPVVNADVNKIANPAALNVGLMGTYFTVGTITAILTANGHGVVSVDQAFIDGGGLATLDALFIFRDGAGLASSNMAAIQAFVSGGGRLITEFEATVEVVNNFGFCSAGSLDVSWGIPSGAVCGGNEVTITDPSHPLATGLPASWSCSADPIGVFYVFGDLDPDFEVVATVNADQNSDGLDDPVVATCCVEAGVWVAFFTDFGDFTGLRDPYTCPPTCEHSTQDEILLTNAIELALGGCEVAVNLDIKPTSCPNPLQVPKVRTFATSAGAGIPGSNSVLPVAILGTDEFDVSTIDPASILLQGVAPLRWALEDVAAPVVDGEECECTTAGPDGYMDLTLKFSRVQIVEALGPVSDGDVLVLTLTGNLAGGGLPIVGSDCVIIRTQQSDPFHHTLLTAGVENGIAAWNQPNPFNAGTTITYLMSEGGSVDLIVYNILGQEVATLVNADQEAGQYTITWNGRNAAGDEVSSGMYLYRLQVGELSLVRKMVLLK